MQWGGVRQGAGTEEVRKGELGGGLGWARRGGQRAMQSSPGGPGDRCLPLLALNTCVKSLVLAFSPPGQSRHPSTSVCPLSSHAWLTACQARPAVLTLW